VIDLSTGDTMGDLGYTWPPLICWPKAFFPSHPREAREPGSILLWRSHRAAEFVTDHVGPVAVPVTVRAVEILHLLPQLENLPRLQVPTEVPVMKPEPTDRGYPVLVAKEDRHGRAPEHA
jgi:hypothetical protein